MPLSPVELQARHIMEAVRVLHKKGYGRLRLLCYVKEGLPAWRHKLFASDEFAFESGSVVSEGSLPGWPVVRGETPEQIADRIEEKFPDLMMLARGEPGRYAAWFAEVLDTYPEGILEMEVSNSASLINGGNIRPPFSVA